MTYKTIKERFDSRFVPVTESGCWIWLGNLTKKGYGVMSFERGKRRSHAHRVAYELYRGPIPDGLVVCHKCDAPSCVNPAHLFIGTQADNLRDMHTKGRRSSDTGSPGVLNHNAKLTDLDALAIFRSPRPQRTLASEFGVSQRAVWQIKNKRAWLHIHNQEVL